MNPAEVTKILRKSLFTFLLSKARQAKMKHIKIKISQPIFGIWYFDEK